MESSAGGEDMKKTDEEIFKPSYGEFEKYCDALIELILQEYGIPREWVSGNKRKDLIKVEVKK